MSSRQWFHFWILAVVVFATPVLLNVIRGQRGKTGLERATTLSPMSKREGVAYMLAMAPQFLLPLYAVFVPFTDNVALLSIGLSIFIIGQALRLKSIWDYSTAPPDQLITCGVYQ